MQPSLWPELPLEAWQGTYATLHMWTQIVGKVRLALSPHINHWWEVPLYVNARGLTTSPIPYEHRTFEVQFDFIEHELAISVNDGRRKSLPLRSQTVADFYAEFLATLRSLGIERQNLAHARLKSQTRSDSIRTNSTLPMTASTHNDSGASWFWSTAYSRNSAAALSGSTVPYIFSGAALIWRPRAFRDAVRLCGRGLMPSRAMPIRTK